MGQSETGFGHGLLRPFTESKLSKWVRGVKEEVHLGPHLAVRHASCMICRCPILPREKCGAVYGNWERAIFEGITSAFKFPNVRHAHDPLNVEDIPLNSYAKFHSVGRPPGEPPSQAYVCRKKPSECQPCLDSKTTFVFHYDCWKLVKRCSKQQTISPIDIWTIGTWTQPFPRREYPASGTLKWLNWDLEAIRRAGPMPWLTRHLPRGMYQCIFHRCVDTPVFRIASALQAVQEEYDFLSKACQTQYVSLSSITEWERGGVYEPLPRPDYHNSIIRVYMDHFGARRVESLPGSADLKATAVCEKTDAWFMVERTQDIDNATAEIKNGRLRINTSNSIRLWDVPDPPAMKDIVWYDPDNVPSRLHCLDLRGCCGLNFVFSRLGTLVWVHAQYRNPTLPEDFTIPVEHQVSHHDSVRVFVPLAHGETIDSLCVLRSRVEGPRATRFQGIHITTSLGRSRFLGGRNRTWDTASELLVDRDLTHLIMSDDQEDCGVFNIGCVCLPDALNPKGLPTRVKPRRNLAQMMHPVHNDTLQYVPEGFHVSSAALEGAVRAFVYRRSRPDGSEQPVTAGILIEFRDGSLEMIGSHHPRDTVEVLRDPLGFHWRYLNPGGIGVTLTTTVVLPKYKTYTEAILERIVASLGWYSKKRGETIMWCFDESGFATIL